MEPLVHLPVDRWGELKELFKTDWPRCVPGFITLETLEEILQRGLDYGFKVYCPFGELSNGMVIINTKSTYNEVIIQTPNNDTRKLEEALLATKLINWNNTFEVPFAPQHVIDCILKVNLNKKMKAHLTATDTFILDKDKTLFENVSVPDGCTFKFLTLEDVELIDSMWPHRYAGSCWYFELLIRAGSGYGLYEKEKLISWVFMKEMGALGHLFTLEEHRKKGYGELMLKLISNILLKRKKYVVAFCVEGNAGAYKLYKKLGFELINEVKWCTLTPS